MTELTGLVGAVADGLAVDVGLGVTEALAVGVGLPVADGLAGVVVSLGRRPPVIAAPLPVAEGLAGGTMFALVDGDGLGDGEDDVPEEDGDGVGVGVGIELPKPCASTGRKSSFAVVASDSRIASLVTPGIDTMMLAFCPLPWVVTSDSATPKPSTRWRMISTACLSWSSVIAPPV